MVTFTFLAMPVFAAEVRIDSNSREIKTNQQFTATVFLNAEESVNALEGQIIFPADIVDLVEIQSGNSIVSFWIDGPKTEAGKIIFSGIAPGGFQGKNGRILSITFQAKKSGNGSIIIRNIKILKNDGAGTAAKTTTSDFQFSVAGEIAVVAGKKKADREAPEIFHPEVARNKLIFDGSYFIVFETQDKQSGVDHYEAQETRFASPEEGRWVKAESPFKLSDQSRKSFIFIKAVDKAGNERMVSVSPAPVDKKYPIIVLGSIIIALAALFAFKNRTGKLK